jgi:hypothetical protein
MSRIAFFPRRTRAPGSSHIGCVAVISLRRSVRNPFCRARFGPRSSAGAAQPAAHKNFNLFNGLIEERDNWHKDFVNTFARLWQACMAGAPALLRPLL